MQNEDSQPTPTRAELQFQFERVQLKLDQVDAAIGRYPGVQPYFIPHLFSERRYLERQAQDLVRQIALLDTQSESPAKTSAPQTSVQKPALLGGGRDGGTDKQTAQRLMDAELARRRTAVPPEPLPNSMTEMAAAINGSAQTLNRWRREGVLIFDAEWLAHLDRIRPTARRST